MVSSLRTLATSVLLLAVAVGSVVEGRPVMVARQARGRSPSGHLGRRQDGTANTTASAVASSLPAPTAPSVSASPSTWALADEMSAMASVQSMLSGVSSPSSAAAAVEASTTSAPSITASISDSASPAQATSAKESASAASSESQRRSSSGSLTSSAATVQATSGTRIDADISKGLGRLSVGESTITVNATQMVQTITITKTAIGTLTETCLSPAGGANSTSASDTADGKSSSPSAASGPKRVCSIAMTADDKGAVVSVNNQTTSVSTSVASQTSVAVQSSPATTLASASAQSDTASIAVSTTSTESAGAASATAVIASAAGSSAAAAQSSSSSATDGGAVVVGSVSAGSAAATSALATLASAAAASGTASATVTTGAAPSVLSAAASATGATVTTEPIPLNPIGSAPSQAAVTTPAPSATNSAGVIAGEQVAGAQSSAAAVPFVLPGTQLQVLPIGLGVFAGVSVIALVVVAVVTFERRKYRRMFRERKEADRAGGLDVAERVGRMGFVAGR